MRPSEIWRRLVYLAHRREREREIEEEMRFHAEMSGAGQFGNLLLLKEESREAWGFGPFDRLAQDVRYGLRILLKSPAFTLVAVVSLALGIGANTAVFSLIDALLLRPLPIPHPEELMMLTSTNLYSGGITSFPYPFYRELREQKILDGVFCIAGMQPSLFTHGSAERVIGEMVSGNYFDLLGVHPYAGRLLQPGDETAAGANRVAVLSYGFWQRRFAGDRSIIGKTIQLNTLPMTVVGIIPPGFSGLQAGYSPDVRVPITMQAEMYNSDPMLDNPRDHWLNIIGRIKPAVPKGRVEAALTNLMHNFQRRNAHSPQSGYARRVLESVRMFMVPAGNGIESRATDAARQLYLLMTVVALVLLIACVNIANLLLARNASRQREIAVRLSLGATRGRLIRQLLTESVLLSIIGGAVGVLLAKWGARILISFLVAGQQGVSLDATPDWRVLVFTVAISLATGILFGLVPAIGSARCDVAPELKGERRPIVATRIGWRKVLVSVQIALSLLLLIGAGLFLRSLIRIENHDPGFDWHHVQTLSLDPIQTGYTPERARLFYRTVIAKVSGIPGVLSAAFASVGLVSHSRWGSGITVEGYRPSEDDRGPLRNAVGPGYFSTLLIPIVRGREFSPRDTFDAPHVAIVNERFAKFYFGSNDPIGRHIGPGGSPGIADSTIVGVAKDGKYATLREDTPRFWYTPYEQSTDFHSFTLYIRTVRPPESVLNDVRRTIAAVDPTVPVYNVRTLREQIDENLARDRMVAALSAFFAVLAALLAAIGLYGVVSYSVAARTREIGIRMALGAGRKMVIGPILRETAVLAAAGTALGTAGALALARLVASLLFDTAPTDGTSFIGAAVLMLAVALLAGYLPARRAARVDPAAALRYD